MPAAAFVITFVPRWADIDANQHMRHSAFADWAAYARSQWLKDSSFDVKRLVSLGVAPIMFEDKTRYFKEILINEQISIELQLAGTNTDASRWFLRHTFRRDDVICAIYEARGAWFDIAARRLGNPPAGLLEAYANIARTDDYVDIISGERVLGKKIVS
jgi:acyl-CoA thioester hydrolase